MNCFMFPGQPLARGASLPEDDDFAEVADLVRTTTRFDLEKFAWLQGGGTENVKLQISGVAWSLYCLRRLRSSGVRPGVVTQHSMGIYAALAACGSISETEAVEIAWRVGSVMARMGEQERYALGCIIGLTANAVLSVARNHGVHIANHNTSRHFLLSGREEDVAGAVAEAVENGAFSVKTFQCDAPLHTPLMDPLEQELREIFSQYSYRDPVCPLIDHIEQNYLTAAMIADFLLVELSQPVYWERSFRAARDAGANRFFEVGAGDSLKKYNRWIEAEIEA